jgi:hypothetical protein
MTEEDGAGLGVNLSVHALELGRQMLGELRHLQSLEVA